MRIVFSRAAGGGSLATVYRADGVVVQLPFHSRRQGVPHDLAHAVAERELELAGGVFGSIAAGAMFGGMRVAGGRQRHDAAARSRRVLAANRATLTLSELLAGALHHAVEGSVAGTARLGAAGAGASGTGAAEAGTAWVGAAGDGVAELARRGWGALREEPFPWTDEQVRSAVAVLGEFAGRWADLGPGDGLEFHWPDRLATPVPPMPARHRSAARRQSKPARNPARGRPR